VSVSAPRDDSAEGLPTATNPGCRCEEGLCDGPLSGAECEGGGSADSTECEDSKQGDPFEDGGVFVNSSIRREEGIGPDSDCGDRGCFGFSFCCNSLSMQLAG